MDSSKAVFERDEKFLKIYSVGAGICAVLVAVFILVNVISMLMSIP